MLPIRDVAHTRRATLLATLRMMMMWSGLRGEGRFPKVGHRQNSQVSRERSRLLCSSIVV